MPILIVIFLVAACVPVDWPEPEVGGARGATTLMLAALLLPLAAHHALAQWALTNLPRRSRSFVVEKYARLRRLIGLAHFGLSIAVIALGWGWVVTSHFLPAPFAELLVPLPYVLGVFGGWALHYDVERALHQSSAVTDAAYWSRGGHFLSRLRPYLLLVLMPAGLFAAQQTLFRLAPAFARSQPMQIATLALGPLLFLGLPLIAPLALGWTSLPPGRHRERLEATARRLNFHCTDLLIWRTHNTLANALVLGLIPQARYVVFTDRLLNELDDDELDAVFGHEIGHVRHGHLVYYAAFLLLSMTLIIATVAGLALVLLPESEQQAAWLTVLPLGVFAAYLFLVFGFLSRKCERQADLYGVRTVAGSRTEGHPQAAGVFAMTRALEKVALLNGLENSFGDGSAGPLKRLKQRMVSWQHGSIADRLEFLQRTLAEEELEAQSQWRITAFRWGVLVSLIAGIVMLGIWLGWDRLAAMM